jgi:hypothetical protein
MAFYKSVKPAMESVVTTVKAFNKLVDACKECEKAAKDAGNADLEETFKIMSSNLADELWAVHRMTFSEISRNFKGPAIPQVGRS